MLAPRTQAAVIAGKVARGAVRALGSGGTALPGLVAERIDPDVVRRLAGQLDDLVLVTGTNGKTTTARMLAAIVVAAGHPLVHNRAGSNLMRGMAAALIEAAAPSGRLPRHCLGVFEIDEATLPAAVAAAPPRVLIIGNLLRDQLDRYGEIDAVRERWVRTIAALPDTTTLVLNADDPSVATLAAGARGQTLMFGVEDETAAMSGERAADHAADALWDPETGADYVYDRRFFAHLGHWRGPAGGATRPRPSVYALNIDPQSDAGRGAAFDLVHAGGTTERAPERVLLPLRGLYNVYNALAAAAAARALGIGAAAAGPALSAVRTPFGRQEELTINGHSVTILLGKNPAGLNEVLRTLARPRARHHLLVLLNDDVADGKDISWIWDTDWEDLAPYVESLVLGGARAADMALRLRYAGLPEPSQPLHHDVGHALRQAFAALPSDAPLIVLPTYTALLDVRARLGRMARGRGFWEVA